jgi:hypothetical protein
VIATLQRQPPASPLSSPHERQRVVGRVKTAVA